MAKAGFVINIVGNTHTDTMEDAVAFEYGAASLAHDLVTRLTGVSHASFGGNHYVAPDLFNPPKPPITPTRKPPEPSQHEGPEGIMQRNPPAA